MNPAEITAILVTTGKHDISEVRQSLQIFGQVLEPIGSPDMCIYARYAAVKAAAFPVIAFVDDDTIPNWEKLVALYQPGKIVCNMPRGWHDTYTGTGISLVGFGSIMDREILRDPFRKYREASLPWDGVFLRECDRVFTYLHRDLCVWVEVPMRQMAYSNAPDRMYVQRNQPDDWREIRRRLRGL